MYQAPAYGDYERQKADTDNVLVWKIASNGRVPVFRLDMGGRGFLESVLAGRIESPTLSITDSHWTTWKDRLSGISPVETLLASTRSTFVSGVSPTMSRTSCATGTTRRPARPAAREVTSTPLRTRTSTRAPEVNVACVALATGSASALAERGE